MPDASGYDDRQVVVVEAVADVSDVMMGVATFPALLQANWSLIHGALERLAFVFGAGEAAAGPPEERPRLSWTVPPVRGFACAR